MDARKIPGGNNPKGRPPKIFGGHRRDVYLDQVTWDRAKIIGGGKASEGIRIAVALASK